MFTSDISRIDVNILNRFVTSDLYEKNKCVDLKYFQYIDTEDKAYILGYIAAQHDSGVNSIDLYENTILFYSFTCSNVINIKNHFNENIKINKLDEAIYYFKISNSEIVNHIYHHIFDGNQIYFPDFENETLTLGFIRGYFDKSGIIKNSKITPVCSIPYDNTRIVDKIKYIINIPNTFDINSNCVIFSNVNAIDFLGKIYKHNSNSIRSVDFYNAYLNIIDDGNEEPAYCKVTVKDKHAVVPSKVRESDVGYDLTIIRKVKDFNNTTSLYDTGISIEIQPGYYAEIVPRSSISKSGYILANNIGIIDPGYRGNLYVALSKIDKESLDIELPFKCCQLIIKKQSFVNLYVDNDNITETNRNSGGFGSTGK